MKVLRVLIILLLTTIVSCNQADESVLLPVINIEQGVQNCNEVFLSEYCSEIEYIPLDSEKKFP